MKTRAETVYNLEEGDHLSVCEHPHLDGIVSLGSMSFVQDFSIYFTKGQLPALRDLIKALMAPETEDK